MKELVPTQTHEVEMAYSVKDCVEKYKNGTEARNEAIYEAYLLGEDDFKEFIATVGVGIDTIKNAVLLGKTKKTLNYELVRNLNISETCLSLGFGSFSRLRGKTPQEKESNFQEIYNALERETLPTGYEIEVYNALKSSALTGEQLRMVKPVFNHIAKGSNALKAKFRNAPKPFKLKKLLNAIENNADESILISIADTGKSIPSTSTCADKKKIKRLEEEIAELKQKLIFFEDRLATNKIRNLMRLFSNTVHALKKNGGNSRLMDALRLLGVEITVNKDELKKAYREKVNLHHPDKGGDEAIFIKVTEANNIIKKYIEGLVS